MEPFGYFFVNISGGVASPDSAVNNSYYPRESIGGKDVWRHDM